MGMHKVDLIVGHNYVAKISNRVVTVRLDKIEVVESYSRRSKNGVSTKTVYRVTNLRTGRKTTFVSAGKFRSRAVDTTKVDELIAKYAKKKEDELKATADASLPVFKDGDYVTIEHGIRVFKILEIDGPFATLDHEGGTRRLNHLRKSNVDFTGPGMPRVDMEKLENYEWEDAVAEFNRHAITTLREIVHLTDRIPRAQWLARDLLNKLEN